MFVQIYFALGFTDELKSINSKRDLFAGNGVTARLRKKKKNVCIYKMAINIEDLEAQLFPSKVGLN